jgi:hypothetical protein
MPARARPTGEVSRHPVRARQRQASPPARHAVVLPYRAGGSEKAWDGPSGNGRRSCPATSKCSGSLSGRRPRLARSQPSRVYAPERQRALVKRRRRRRILTAVPALDIDLTTMAATLTWRRSKTWHGRTPLAQPARCSVRGAEKLSQSGMRSAVRC